MLANCSVRVSGMPAAVVVLLSEGRMSLRTMPDWVSTFSRQPAQGFPTFSGLAQQGVKGVGKVVMGKAVGLSACASSVCLQTPAPH